MSELQTSASSISARTIVPTTELDQSRPVMICLPHTLKTWSWPRTINPHWKEVAQESDAWIKAFKPFNNRAQHAFDLGNFGLLSALVYPKVSRDHLRIATDLMVLAFAIDAYTDAEPLATVEEMTDGIIDAVQNPSKPRPKGENILGEIAREYWTRLEMMATPEANRHTMESLVEFLNSLVVQARHRDDKKIPTIDEYIRVRRENIGVRPAFAMGRLYLAIPDDVLYHPVMKELETLVLDMIILTNDVLSYNKEQATGDDQYNIITTVMHQLGLSLPDAFGWAAKYHEDNEAKFLDVLRTIPSWGDEIDSQIAVYVDYLGNWERANICWSFESRRYFGSRGLEIQKTRHVPLLPKRSAHLQKDDIAIPIVDSLYI